jgi:hypothetical protein
MAMGLASSFALWLGLRWAAGFASAFLFVFISTWSLERVSAFPMLRAAVFSGVGAGIFAVGVACLALDRADLGSSVAWVVLGAATLVLSVMLWPLFSGGRTSPPDEVLVADRVVTRAWRLIVSYGLFGFGYIIPATFLPVMGKAGAGSEWAIALAWPAFGLAAFASTFGALRISAQASSVHIWRIAQAALAIALVLPAMSGALSLVIVSGAIVGGTFVVITMTAIQSAREFAGGNAQRLIAAMTAAFAAGQLAGPLTVPLLVTAGGDFSKALLVAAGALATGIFLLPLKKENA